MKTLVVYYSRKGYTAKLAKSRAGELCADLLRLETTEKTSGYPGFWWCGRFAMHRWEMPLVPYDINPWDYDRVVVCTPVWVATLSAPVRAFLRQSKGMIKQTEYIIVHFSPLMFTKSIARKMNSIVGIDCNEYTDVMCIWGHILKKRKHISI